MAKIKPVQSSLTKRRRAAQRRRQPIGPILIALGALLFVGALAWSFWPRDKVSNSKTEVTGAAALRSDRDKVDLGDVHLGTTVSASFKLTNSGDKPLHFTKDPYIQVADGC